MIYKETVGRKCKCHSCKKEMFKGDIIYVIDTSNNYGHIEKTRYCRPCTIKYIKRELEDLNVELCELEEEEE